MSMSGGALPIDDDGIWIEFADRRRPRAVRRPALFLDRDGVVVEDTGYLSREADVRLISGASAVIARANRLGVPVIVVSNQSGIGRGLFDWAAFARVQAHINDLLAAEAARIDAVLACPHHPLAASPYTHPDAPWRKPNPGMLLKAAAHLNIELARSWIVGDRANDLLAGRRAGLAGGVHVATGEGRGEDERRLALALDEDCFRVAVVDSIAGVSAHVPLLADERRRSGFARRS
jgi:D-glycero-D-manno-heptose 1,7-bisphosphate phosphatase